jgi:hypothetical protein
MEALIDEMLDRFEQGWSEKAPDEELIFRIHWDGDFFSQEYMMAWMACVARRPHVLFWAYTRSLAFVGSWCELPNFTLYLSIDEENADEAEALRRRFSWLMGAYCAPTFRASFRLAGQEVVRCPENAQIKPLVGESGKGACVECRICITGKRDIAFASLKREDVEVAITRGQRSLF